MVRLYPADSEQRGLGGKQAGWGNTKTKQVAIKTASTSYLTRGPPKPRNGGRPPLKAEKRVLDEVGRLYRAAGRGIGLGGGCVSRVCGVFVGHVLWRYRVYL